MNVAALIIGIDGWDRYTKPLIDSIRQHEPDCSLVVVDNASETPYPSIDEDDVLTMARCPKRLSYSQAINYGKLVADVNELDVVPNDYAGESVFDWYIVLSNDVLCTGPFAQSLEDLRDCVAGPQLWSEHGLSWIVGWCVAIPRNVWDAAGGWDEG